MDWLDFVSEVFLWLGGALKQIGLFLKDVSGVIAAFLAYHFAKQIEPLKFTYKQKEIRYTVAYKQKLEALEGIAARVGEVVETYSNVVTAVEMSENEFILAVKGVKFVDDQIGDTIDKLAEASDKLKEIRNTKTLYISDTLNVLAKSFHEQMVEGVQEKLSGITPATPLEQKEKMLRESYTKPKLHILLGMQTRILAEIRSEIG